MKFAIVGLGKIGSNLGNRTRFTPLVKTRFER